MTYTDQSFENAFVSYLHESDFENSGDIVSEHICHQNIGIVAITWPETEGDVLNDVEITFEKF